MATLRRLWASAPPMQGGGVPMRGPRGGGGGRGFPRRRTSRPETARARLVLTVGAVLVATACSSGSGAKPIGAPSPTSTTVSGPSSSTSSVDPPTTTIDPTDAAILAAYRGMWTDSDAVAHHFPINVFDPILGDHIAGAELTQIQNFLTSLKVQGQYAIGPPIDTSRAIVKQLVGTAAVVSDCAFDGSVIVSGLTNQVVKPATTQRALVNAKVELIDGVWKVTELNNVSVGCTTAS
jgi:hypothetical protein